MGAPSRVHGSLECRDGWAAAQLLLALSEEDAATNGAIALAASLRRGASDEAYAREVHAFVKRHVRFEREVGEIFQSGAYTLNQGVGDCDDHFRLVYGLAVAGGIRSDLGILHHGTVGVPVDDQGPAHAAALLLGKWAETTVNAFFGERPNDAAARLGLTTKRSDIAREIVIMSASDLPPLPPGFRERHDPRQVVLDCEALQRLGYLTKDAPLCALVDPTEPMIRRAVLAFQIARGITADGLLGPETRGAIAKVERAAAGSSRPPGIGALVDPRVPPPADASDISDEFLELTKAMAERFQEKGARATAEDFLRVWFVESAGLRNVQNFGGEPYAGINQMGPQERKNAGFFGTLRDWLELPIERQLPFVEKFYVGAAAGHFDRFRDAASLYVANIAPAHIAFAGDPDHALYRYRPEIPGMPLLGAPESEWVAFNRSHSDPYAENHGLDRARKGFISVGDMGLAVRAGSASSPRWGRIETRIRAMGGGTSPLSPIARLPSGSSGAGTAIVLVGMGLATAAITWWSRS